jgi:hypothetical protein
MDSRTANDPEKAAVDFLRTEIATGHTFVEMALTSDDSDKRTRNREFAQTACDTVVRFLPRVALNAEERDEINGGLAGLQAAIDCI